MTGAPPRVAAIVLAAGASTRLGTPKQLLDYEGEPLVRRAARMARAAGADPVIVVLGAMAERIAPALDGLAGVRIVHNPDWASGMASSLRAGLTALDDAAVDAVLVTLADQPLVDAAALATLVAAFPGAHGLVAAEYGDALGVPALFATRYVDELSRLGGDSGAGAWLRRRSGDVTRVPLAAAAFDVDVPADAERLDGAARSTT